MTSTNVTTKKISALEQAQPAAWLNVKKIARHQHVLLATITLMAAALRFYKLGQWSFWIDEIFTIDRAQAHANLETIVREWWQPSISTILTGTTLDLLGVNEWTARLPAAVIGILSIPILYFPIKKLWGVYIGLIAALLLAVAPWHIYWSQNARYFASLLLFYSLASFVFFFAIEQDRPRYLFVFFLLLYLAMGERIIAAFLVPVIVVYWLLLKLLPLEKPPGFRTRNMLLLLLPAVAAVLFDFYRLATTGTSSLAHATDAFYGTPVDSPVRIIILVFFNVGIPLVILALFGGIFLVLQKSRAGLFFLLGAIVPLLLLAALNPFAFTSDRYVFLTLPCWIILAAVAIKELVVRSEGLSKMLATAILFVLLADAAGTHLMYYQLNHGNRLDWRSAFAYILERKAPEDVIVSPVQQLAAYYTGQPVVWLGDINPDEIVQDNRRYWFVTDSQHSWWSAEEKLWVEENSELLDVQYLRVRETINLRIYLFDPDRKRP